MIVEDLTCFDKFKDRIDSLKKQFCKNGESRLFFRGQRDSKWELKTTLERTISRPLKFVDYYKLIFAAKPLIDKLEITIPTCSDFEGWLDEEFNLSRFRYDMDKLSPECLRYFAFLRHHDFPSPLLDWTLDINVSLYFAFKHPSSHIPENGSISIYCYCEMPYDYKVFRNGHKIYIFENDNLRVDRHEAQKSRYSMCVKHEKLEDNKYSAIFVPHDSIFQINKDTQDLLWKFNIPFSERAKIIKMLEQEGYTPEKLGFNESFSATSSPTGIQTLTAAYKNLP